MLVRFICSLMAVLMIGTAVTFTPGVARADDDAALVAGGLVVTGLVAWALSNGDDDDREAVEEWAAVTAPFVADFADGWLDSAECTEALGTEGQSMAKTLAGYLIPRLLNKTSSVVDDAQPLVIAWKWFEAEHPDEAKLLLTMAYRVDPDSGIALGIAPRLDAWLTDKGYMGEAELYARLSNGDIDWGLSDSDRDELVELAGVVLVDEYYAAGEYLAAAIRNQSDDLPINAGIDTGTGDL